MIIATHRRASFDYDITKTYEAGVALKGYEVKAARAGKMNISSAFVAVRGRKAFLINASIEPYQPKNTPDSYDPKRTRALLLHRDEMSELRGHADAGLTILPLKVYTKGRHLKLEVGVGRIRKKVDKRDLIRRREAVREMRSRTR